MGQKRFWIVKRRPVDEARSMPGEKYQNTLYYNEEKAHEYAATRCARDGCGYVVMECVGCYDVTQPVVAIPIEMGD